MPKKLSPNTRPLLSNGFNDLKRGFKLRRYWCLKSLINFKLSLQGASLGILWPNLSLLLVVIVLGTVWGVVLQGSMGFEYYLYLLAGYPVWQFLSSSVNKAARGFEGINNGSGMPISIAIFEKISGSVISFLVVLPAVVVGFFLLSDRGFEHFLLLPLAMISLVCWSLGVLFLFGVLVALKPDVRHLVNSIMRLSFLATPIIWEPSRLGEFQSFLWLNPFFPLLELMRYSMSGIVYVKSVVWVAPIYSVSLLGLGLLAFTIFLDTVRYRVS